MSTIHAVTVPQWGLEMTEGSVSTWHIAVGDVITKGREIVDLETSKIVNTMEAMTDLPGVVRRLVAAIGDTVPVGGLLAVTAAPDVPEAEIDRWLVGQGATPVPAAVAPAPVPASVPASVPAPAPAVKTAVQAATVAVAEPRPIVDAEALARLVAANAEVPASPVARRLANRAGLALAGLSGSGRHGRIAVADLPAHLQRAAPVMLPENTGQQQRNATAHASPIARRLAERAGVDLAALRGTGRHGRISVDDVVAACERIVRVAVDTPPDATPGAPAGEVRAGPAARKLAAELGLDLAVVAPSGPRGLVLKSDVQRAAAAPPARPVSPVPPAPAAPVDDHRLVPLTPMRKAIAASLVHSKQTIPHFYLTADLVLDRLMALREAINRERAGQDVRKLSLNDFLLRAVALALRDTPQANVHFTDAGIKQFHGVHLCVAVAIDGGLVTPVIRDAQDKPVFAIAAEAAELAERARQRTLTQAQLAGGTFTVSNLGMFGIRQFDAVINPPQGAILAVGAARREAFEGEGGQVQFRSVTSVTLSCDHRVIDGAVGAALLAALGRWVERPHALLG